MPEATINYLAVLVAAVINMFVGYIWYHQKVFGTAWMQLVGMTEEKAKQGAGLAMGGMFVVALISNYTLAHFVDYTQAASFVDGAVTGFWLWLGFSGAVLFTMVAFERRPGKWFAISAGYQLLVLLVNGGLLATWA